MSKVMDILTTVCSLLVKLLDFYSGLLAKGPLRTALGLLFLLLVLLAIAWAIRPIAYLLVRPFLGGVSDWAASLQFHRKTEPGSPKPYILYMRLSLREIFRAALADVGLYGRTDTDQLVGLLVRRSRNLSEDANFGSLQGLVRRADALRKQSARTLNVVRSIERERAGRLFQAQDYFAETSHLTELGLPNHPGEVRKGFLTGLFMAMLFRAADYHAFRNLIRSGSIRPEGTLLRFHSEDERERFAERMQRSLGRGVPYVLFTWFLMPGKGMRRGVLRYVSGSAGADRLPPLPGEKGPGYEIRFESEQGRQQASFRFEIVVSGQTLHRRLVETGTHEMMVWAAGEASQAGVLLGGAQVTEAGSVSGRHILSERYRLDNAWDRQLLADAICRFVAQQAESAPEREAVRTETPNGGKP